MDARIAELAGLLRSSGVRVSPAEVADAVRAAALAGVEERATLRSALRATLVKRARDVPVFEALFALWSGALGRALEGAERGLLADLREAGLAEDELEAVARTLAQLAGAMTPLARAALAGDPGLLARLLADAAARIDLGALAGPATPGFVARRLVGAAGGAGAEEDAARLAAALAARGLEPATLRRVGEAVGAALRRVDEAARRLAEIHGEARAQLRSGALAASRTPLSREEVARAESAVRRLAERLRTRLVRRDRSRRRGTLSFRRTLRRNLGVGGIPARLVFRSRRPERPDVLVLCDVSESVRHVTRLMLLFLFTLQTLFARVRTFVFVSDLAEVTERLRAERDPARAADLAVAARAVSLAANSNYGRVLRTFHSDFLGAVTRRTTVLVVGDGRNNYNPPEGWVLDEIRRRARRLLWICPEDRSSWGMGDSEMPLYAARCDRVATAATMEELEGIAEQLVPRR
jgi:uncharacterized protein with von Willebrand factor type A (vWA) domain